MRVVIFNHLCKEHHKLVSVSRGTWNIFKLITLIFGNALKMAVFRCMLEKSAFFSLRKITYKFTWNESFFKMSLSMQTLLALTLIKWEAGRAAWGKQEELKRNSKLWDVQRSTPCYHGPALLHKGHSWSAAQELIGVEEH